MAKLRKQKKAWPFYLVVGLIVLALPVGYFFLLGEPPATPLVVAPPPVAQAVELRLAKVEGEVLLKKGDGGWAVAKEGDVLDPSDGVRTSDGSYAVLVGGESYEVKMEPGTEISVSELSASISKLLLANGMATAKVKGGTKHTFEVRAKDTDAVARTQAGTFAISSNGAGTVAVGTREGEVEFLGSGKVVIVRAGQQSVVRPGQAPTDPAPIPSSLLLKVEMPSGVVRTRTIQVAGRVEVGAQVQIAGGVVHVDENGNFSREMKLNEGKNQVDIKAVTVGGLEGGDVHEVGLKTTVKKATVDPNLWK
ncbi:MAG: hypothetical protein ACOZIN_19875 [Myxococcota bacterium]